ncbi:MAG: SulP family inorganic anion transporter [Spirulinaceae cyanobacterium]
MTQLETVLSEQQKPQEKSILIAELHPSKLIPSLIAGLLTGVIGVIRAISYAALIFSGSLSDHLTIGVGIAVFSTAAISIVVALLSSLPGMIATPLAAPTAILAILAGAIAQNMTAGTEDEILVTVVAAIAISSLLTGLFLFILGKLHLGKAIQFIPYPVVGGFMAGTGCLLIRGAIQVLTGEHLTWVNLPLLCQGDILWQWLSGLILGLILLVVFKYYQHFLVMPGIMLAATGIFYLILFLTNTSLVEARAGGWLLGPFPEGELWQPLTWRTLQQVDFSIIASQAATIATVMLISLISLVLTNSGIELAIDKEVDLNQELQAVGLANIAAGLGSGMVGNQALPSTILVYKMGANNRLAGVFKTIPCAAVLLLGSSFLAVFPKPIIGSLLFYLGLDLSVKWLYQAWFKFPLPEYLIIVAIVIIINTIGFLEGVLVGFSLAVLLFAINYSKIEIVKQEFSGQDYLKLSELTTEQKQQIYILQLQGAIFFGTANNLLKKVRQRFAATEVPQVNFIIFDFTAVDSLDSSAVLSFAKIFKLAQNHKVNLLFTNFNLTIKNLLIQGKAWDEEEKITKAFPELEKGLRWCEIQILRLNMSSKSKVLKLRETSK